MQHAGACAKVRESWYYLEVAFSGDVGASKRNHNSAQEEAYDQASMNEGVRERKTEGQRLKI